MRQRNPFAVRDLEALKRRVEDSQRIVSHSVRSLAKVAGVGHATVGHLLTGERTTVSLAVAQRLSAALGVPMEDLFMPAVSTSGDSDKGKRE
jgi:transcriptional regulator with XRE-family HTH domain